MLGKPGHSPNNIVEGGGISKRLLQITSFSAMFFFMPVSRQAILRGIFAQIRSRPARRPQKIPDKKSRTCKQAGYATGFIVIFASGFFNAYT